MALILHPQNPGSPRFSAGQAAMGSLISGLCAGLGGFGDRRGCPWPVQGLRPDAGDCDQRGPESAGVKQREVEWGPFFRG